MQYARILILFFFLSGLIILGTSCKKELTKEYVYIVDSVNVTKSGVYKPNTKNNIEFISIAYSDLFGNTISNDKLTNLSIAYDAFGDKKLMEDLIIRNFLKSPQAIIPSVSEMNSNKETFIKNAYRKFLNREPSEMEIWQFKKIVDEDPSITPEMVYYSFLTSNEYRHY
jgi:hypothetical protein